MDRLPPLRLLVTFDAVARLRSMQSAAAELNVTPPAVTQAIKALEDQIGVELIDRRSKPSRPTEAGMRLAEATRSGLGLVAETIEEIRLLAGLTGRQLTVSCTIGMATYWLMPRLADFYARFDNITVNVQAPPSDLPALTPGINVALRYGRDIWTDGETYKLFDEAVCPVGRADLLTQVANDPQALASAPLIHVRASSAHHWAGWREYFAKRGLAKHRGPTHVFDNYVHAVQAALDGRGIMLGWKSITSKFVQEGTLAALPGGTVDFGTAYFVTWGRNPRNDAAETFVNWLLDVGASEA